MHIHLASAGRAFPRAKAPSACALRCGSLLPSLSICMHGHFLKGPLKAPVKANAHNIYISIYLHIWQIPPPL